MKRRYYVLLIAFTSAVALIGIISALAITTMVDPESKDAMVDDSAPTIVQYTMSESETYKDGNITYYPNEGYHYVIIYADVTSIGDDGVLLSAADFKLIEDGRSQPLAHYSGFGNGDPASGYDHYKLCYEVDKDFSLDDAELKYSGRYWVELKFTEPEKPTR